MTTKAKRNFWETNDRLVSGEMGQLERIMITVGMALAGTIMMVVLWIFSR